MNNPTDVEREALKLPGTFRFIIHQEETAPTTNTAHVQGYFESHVRVSIAGAHKFPGLSRAAILIAKGSAAQNIEYCTKEGGTNPFRNGEPGLDGRKRGGDAERERWDAARLAATEGRFDDIPSDIFIRYSTSLERIRAKAIWDAADRAPVPDIVLKPWQSDLVDLIKMEPDSRKIHCVVDREGGAGKSTFARYLLHTRKDVAVLLPGKGSDLAYAIKPARCYIIDCPRSSGEFICWSFIESLKNGYVFSSKYESTIKSFAVPHVILMMNAPVPEGKMSMDRIDEIDVSNQQTQ